MNTDCTEQQNNITLYTN